MLQKKVLIVEDNEMNRAMLEAILSPEYNVLEAENGEQALAVLEKYGEGISLILLDIMMPVMDGYTFLNHLTTDSRISSIPVIVTTSNDSEADEVAALGRGATDFISKPYRSQVILHRVASIIKLRETAAILNMFQYDRLTGVYSKEFFYQQVQSILLRSPDVKYDILCSDIENFKLINDAYGVAAGDHLLQEVADLHRRRLGSRGICGRMNADQFVCLLEHRDDYTDEMFIQSDNKINNGLDDKNVVIKYGIYTIHDRKVPVEQMCDRALLAVQSIKGQYGRHFAIYDDRLREKLRRRQAITDGMEAALATGQFEVYLQPKYRIWDGQLAGAEALVRWNHPEWGMMPPGEFIPLFEQNGFVTKLDQFVWERSCALLQEWDLKGYPKIDISVNVSRRDIHNTDISDILNGIIQRYGLSPYRLHLEITESAYTDNPRQIIDMVSRLRGLGFIIEMDDFGSGYSSLNMLSDLPIDILKLDMKFIQTEMAKPAGQGILRFIVSLARYMNLSVVAEGVETREHLDRLRENGCDYAQGYYFAKPMPAGDFEQMLALSPESGDKTWRGGNDNTEQVGNLLLIADEDSGYRTEVCKTFEGHYKVQQAADCQEALKVLRQNRYETAVVVLSLSLPGPDGFLLLDAIQKERGAWDIPVIATGPLDMELECRAMKLGAADYAAKPHSQEALRRRVLRAMSLATLQERARSLEKAAFRDPLTGVLNRRGLYTAAKVLRQGAGTSAVYMFDLDDLKQVNDKFGHMGGDELIVHFASLLRAHIRGEDILARMGEDEFVVVMRQMRSEEDARIKGAAICRAFREGHYADSGLGACSAGVALWTGSETIEEMLMRADQALYAAKADGKGGCRLWKGTCE